MFKAGGTGTWITRKPPRTWLPGDPLLFWSSAPDLELVAIGSLVEVLPSRNGATRFVVEYRTALLQKPLGIVQLRKDPIVRRASFLKAGPAATVQRLDSQHARRLLQLIQEANPRLGRICRAWIRRHDALRANGGLRALSVKPPYAYALVTGEKDIENRKWKPAVERIGEWIAIHASSQFTASQHRKTMALMPARLRVSSEELTTSAIIGLVRLAGVTTTSRSKWFEDKFGWLVTDAIMLKKPIPMHGKLGLWRVPPSVQKQLAVRCPQIQLT